MEESIILERLKKLAFARALPQEVLGALARIAQERDFSGGTTIFHEGDRHETLYLICSGNVTLDMQVPLRGSVRIISLHAGDLLGWSPLVGDRTMTATATTQEATTTVAIHGEVLDGLCEADHEIGYFVMRQMATTLSQRLLATRLQLLDLFAETTPRPAN